MHFASYEGVTILHERINELKEIIDRPLVVAEYKHIGKNQKEWSQL